MRSDVYTLITAALFAAAGCSDASTAPGGLARDVEPSDRPSLDYRGPLRFGTRTTAFVLTAEGGTFTTIDGMYTLTVPPDAVCVLGSSYGPGAWDTPCTTLGDGETITVTATTGFTNGGPVVDFSPQLRFNPSAQVTLSTMLYAGILTGARNYFASNQWALRFFGIYYVPSFGAQVVTDAAVDPSVVTHINLQTGLVWRRVKHFSGYNIASGLACDPSPDDPDCVAGPPPVVDQPQ